MKANTRYTALEILSEVAPTTPPGEVFGKTRVTIGGIAGIVKPGHVINIPSGTKEIEVIVGNEILTAKIEGDEKDHTVSEAAKESNEAESKATTARDAKIQADKEKKLKEESKKDEPK